MATACTLFFPTVFTLMLLVQAGSNPHQSDHEAERSNIASTPSKTGLPSHETKKKNLLIRCSIGFSAATVPGIICGIISLVLFNMCLNKVKIKKNCFSLTIFSQLLKAEELAFLKEDDVVGSLQCIGRGGCGEVYKAELPLGKVKTIAIKTVNQPPEDATELSEYDLMLLNHKTQQIKSEVQTVGHIRHRNLVSLLAYVSKPNCHYLIYEFMKNGSLQHILNQVKDGSRELDWLVRHRIALGIASGLEYLHMGSIPRIVHRDLKPDNVLIDDNMEARITDFGLARTILDADTHMLASNFAGTFGYVAPEYFRTLEFTEKCDMYSFGVLLANLVTGMNKLEEISQRTQGLPLMEWLRNEMASNDPKQVIDPNLMGNGYEKQMDLVLKVACLCTLDDPKDRPNSKEARLMLAQIEH